jgi:allantoinase
MEQLGAVAKCAPPLRTQSAQDVLWRYVEGGHVATVGSDHSPAAPEMKQGANFFKLWGGIAGVQHTLPLLVTGFRRRNASVEVAREDGNPATGPDSRWSLALQSIVRLTSYNVAERFRLPPNKGRLVVGADADLALVDLKGEFTVRVEDLFQCHKLSPYLGHTLTGRVVRTILRGTTVFADGKVVAAPVGRLVKPNGI